MYPFGEHLLNISNQITVKDQGIFVPAYEAIRDRLLQYMTKNNSVFRNLYKGPSLFGSYSNNVRINSAKEFDVYIMLAPTYSQYITVKEDKKRPGFVHLNFRNCLKYLENDPNLTHVYEFLYQCTDNNGYLIRTEIQNWMEDLFEQASAAYRYGICHYEIEYSKRGLAHTIFGYNRYTGREISIDFVPCFIFGEEEWMRIPTNPIFSSKHKVWMAVPKPTGGLKWTRKISFMICNSNAEHELLLSKQNLKIVFRLLKSLVKAYGLHRLKSYFITTVFLLEIEEQDNNFWYNSVEYLFVHMLDVLSDCFADGYLPFFWNYDRNLLEILSEYEIEEYKNALISAYNTISSYIHQDLIKYETVAKHFDFGKI